MDPKHTTTFSVVLDLPECNHAVVALEGPGVVGGGGPKGGVDVHLHKVIIKKTLMVNGFQSDPNFHGGKSSRYFIIADRRRGDEGGGEPPITYLPIQ